MDIELIQFEILLSLLFLKHFLFDFVLQSKDMLFGKTLFGNWLGIKHSLYHGAGTFFVLTVVSFECAIIFAIADAIIHYHIDWIRGRFGSKDITSDTFWCHLGLDQLAHGFTYIVLTSLIVKTFVV